MMRGMVDQQDQRIHPAVGPRRIGVCGGSMLEDPAAERFCRALGRELARDPAPILVSGGCHYRQDPKPPGGGLPERLAADWYTIDSAERELGGPDASAVLSRIETMLPDPANESQDVDKHIAKFRKGRVVVYPHSTPQSRRFRFVSSLDVLVAISGGTGTVQNLQLAFALGVPTLLVPQFAEKKMTSRLCEEEAERVQRWFGIPPAEWQGWMEVRNHPKDGATRMSPEDIEKLAARCASLLIERLKLPCFVIMPFRKGYDALFKDAIKPAVEAAGYLPVRTDMLNAPGEILATIGRGIENCACAIAVITGLQPNVMYELGLAHAHRKPVLILLESSQDEVERRAPFDVKTHAILGYTTVDEDLKERIRSMLVETRWSLIAPPHLAFHPAKLEESAG
jgi:predicted Rossmann-fold nucleotide-binding protein